RALLTSSPEGTTQYIHHDARDPQAILEAAAESLDVKQPVAVMLLSVLHFLSDEDVRTTVGTLMEALPAGSFLAVAHGTTEYADDAVLRGMEHWNANSPTPIHLRTRDELAPLLLDGLELLEPGIVSCSRWRP
ncbi:MAG: SAM-dependent methyltransferase, partial [Kitasatospora sp.]|nr:SAM-dependent methyltransferase [Kitasatospora sp.]